MEAPLKDKSGGDPLCANQDQQMMVIREERESLEVSHLNISESIKVKSKEVSDKNLHSHVLDNEKIKRLTSSESHLLHDSNLEYVKSEALAKTKK